MQQLQAQRAEKKATLPAEPAEVQSAYRVSHAIADVLWQDQPSVRIVIQHASGRLQRRFCPSDLVAVMHRAM